MEFVVRLLQRCFGMTRQEASRTMLKVHTEGSAIVGYAEQSVAEQLVAHVIGVSRKRGFSLQCRIVPAKYR